MSQLHETIAGLVQQWRAEGYPCAAFPAIAEILEWPAEPESGTLRFLRRPQVRALETYWYLRLIEGTPHIFDLYRKYFPKPSQLVESLGLTGDEVRAHVMDDGVEGFVARVKTDDEFVRQLRLESLRETLTLDYPSYILALAMGAGKTILIGAVIATEFAMALEYPEGPFVQNALVFAPGTTIVESLRELAQIPYDALLPPRLFRSFAASVKLTFTRDGEKDIPVIRRSSFNVVVTNTEKIRIQKETIRKSDLGTLFSEQAEDAARSEVANLRLQAIASLPSLAVFSDEAHHTYGQSMDRELKKVRKTVDYLAAKTNVVAVVNTTGTPYFQRQPLKDVIFWYGLRQGIVDGYLKDLAGNIRAYRFDEDVGAYVAYVVKDFFKDYRDVCLPNGAPAKLAIYFPQTDDLKQVRPVIDQALADVGQSPTVCLVNTSDSSLTKEADIAAFNRLNDPRSPQRVILLVNKGTEGWNCPSLFACALARKLKKSNNFVLQAATRCLRQVPGNLRRARVYLSMDNFGVLDRQLQETYGESISTLNYAPPECRRTRIVLRKADIPPLVVTQLVRTVIRKEGQAVPLRLARPTAAVAAKLRQTTYTLAQGEGTTGVLTPFGDSVTIETPLEHTDVCTAAVDLAACYRLDLWTVYDQLRGLYGDDDVPLAHLDALGVQIEEQTRFYEVTEEEVEVALALVKPDGFRKGPGEDGVEVYTADIVYPKDREHLLLSWKAMQGTNPSDFGFHYDPYNFDSLPEKAFFEQMLEQINLSPGEVEDIYFTGALTDPGKTDFFVEYKDQQGAWRRYTPDFVIRKRPGRGRKKGTGRVFIVEIKREHDRDHAIDGAEGLKAAALRQWEALNPDRLRYQIVFTDDKTVQAHATEAIRRFVGENEE
jgi:type III restriction enzyme